MKNVTIAMGARRDGWVSSEIHFAQLRAALARMEESSDWNFRGWSSGVWGPASLRRRVFYPLDLRAKVSGNLHLIDQSYADALLGYEGPAVLTIADINFWRARGGNSWRQRARERIVEGARKATRIIAISHATASEVERDLGISREKIRVVPFAIDDSFFDAAPELSPELRLRIAGRPFLLHVGSLDERKGLTRFLESFRLLREIPLLVQAGGIPTPQFRALVYELGLMDRVLLLGPQPRSVVHALYGATEALIFPSSYEGFGVPPLEARAAGARIITTVMPSVCEALEFSARLNADGSPHDWAEATRAALAAPSPGPLWPEARKKFSWDRVARDTLAVYCEVF